MGRKSVMTRIEMVRRLRTLLPVMVLALLASPFATAATAQGPKDSDSATSTAAAPWRDDFNSLNPATWRKIDSGCFDPGNASVSNGMLQMTIARSSRSDCPGVTGARINTYGLREWTSGTFSARIRFVTAPGSWQTFWLTGAGGKEFPANGEVDVAEIIGRTPQNTHLALHSAFKTGGTRRCDLGAGPSATVNNVWHTYSVTTGATGVTFLIDGVSIAHYAPGGACTWPFGDPMRILFSSRGGQYGGTVDVKKYPITYQVDWVSWHA